MPKYYEEIKVRNDFIDDDVVVDVEYETCLSWRDKEIFDITDMVLTSKTGVVLNKKTFSSEYLEEVEERLLEQAIKLHGGD